MLPANMNLEPGIKALVVGFNKDPVNLGKVVMLLSFHKKGEIVEFESGKTVAGFDCWLVEGEDLSRSTRSVSTGNVKLYVGKEGVFAPCDLMPIRPEEDPLEVAEHEINLQKA